MPLFFPEAMIPALELCTLEKRYEEKRVLQEVSLTVYPGDFLALLGPNGAGKSTMISLISGVIKKTSGEIRIFGKSFDDDPQWAKMQIGIMPQEIALDSFFTTQEILENHAALYGKKDPEYCTFLLKRLHLWDQRNTNTRLLSGGMKRRLMIGKALVHRPSILVLDEPTTGVDVELRRSLWDFIRELHQQGTTVLLTTHYLEEAEALAQKVAILHQGRLLAVDTPENLLSQFGTREIAIFLKRPIPPPPFLSQENDTLLGLFSEERAPEIFAFLADHAGDIADIKIREPRLEEVFLRCIR